MLGQVFSTWFWSQSAFVGRSDRLWQLFSNKNPTGPWACGVLSVEILFPVLSWTQNIDRVSPTAKGVAEVWVTTGDGRRQAVWTPEWLMAQSSPSLRDVGRQESECLPGTSPSSVFVWHSHRLHSEYWPVQSGPDCGVAGWLRPGCFLCLNNSGTAGSRLEELSRTWAVVHDG